MSPSQYNQPAAAQTAEGIAFWERNGAGQECQYRPTETETLFDPITGRRGHGTAARANRVFEYSEDPKILKTALADCYFCQWQTPPNLFVVRADGTVAIPVETAAVEEATMFLKGKPRSEVGVYRDLVKLLAKHNRIEFPWLTRTFPNLTPGITSGNCYVTAVHPDWHYANAHDISKQVFTAVVKSWQFIEEQARWKRLVTVFFINGGKRPESGQSIACFHAQTYTLDDNPSLYQQIANRRQEIYGGKCAVCTEVLTPEFRARFAVFETDLFLVAAHPSPKHSWGLLVVSKSHVADLSSLPAADFAAALQGSLRCYARLFNREPAFNIVVRAGDAVGHLHAEILPRTETNIRAGFEEAAQEYVIDVPPAVVKQRLSRLCD